VRIHDFKSQQHRWTKGSAQTARKLLGRIWRAPVPLRCKIEAGFHLISNVCYVLMVTMTLMIGPACIARSHVDWDWAVWLDVPLLVATTISIIGFYLQSQWAIGRRGWRTAALMPLVMSLGIGISISNALAVIEGWIMKGGEFVRTPKYCVQKSTDACPQKSYACTRKTLLPWIEGGAFLYSLWVTAFGFQRQMWLVLPFLLLFNFGFGWVTVLNWLEHRPRRAAMRLAES
jgi:hypothetical protein